LSRVPPYIWWFLFLFWGVAWLPLLFDREPSRKRGISHARVIFLQVPLTGMSPSGI